MLVFNIICLINIPKHWLFLFSNLRKLSIGHTSSFRAVYTLREISSLPHPGPDIRISENFWERNLSGQKKSRQIFPWKKKNIWKKMIFRPFQNQKFKTHLWGKLRIGNLALTRGNLFFKYFVKLKTYFKTQFRDHFGRAGKYDKKAWWKTPF